MRLDLKRDAILIIPESDVDQAFIEDSLGLKRDGDTLTLKRVEEVALGYKRPDSFVLKGLVSPVLPRS